MPKPIFSGCCACAEPASAMTSAMRPFASQLFSLLIGGLLLGIDDAYTAVSALSIDAGLSQVPVRDLPAGPMQHARMGHDVAVELLQIADAMRHPRDVGRSEERRVGKECRDGWQRWQ